MYLLQSCSERFQILPGGLSRILSAPQVADARSPLVPFSLPALVGTRPAGWAVVEARAGSEHYSQSISYITLVASVFRRNSQRTTPYSEQIAAFVECFSGFKSLMSVLSKTGAGHRPPLPSSLAFALPTCLVRSASSTSRHCCCASLSCCSSSASSACHASSMEQSDVWRQEWSSTSIWVKCKH